MDVQALLYMQGFAGPAPYAGLYRSCTIRKAVLALQYMQGFAGNALHTELYRPCTLRKAVQALQYTQVCIGPEVYTAKTPVLNQPAVVLLARVDSQSAC